MHYFTLKLFALRRIQNQIKIIINFINTRTMLREIQLNTKES